MSSTRHTAEKPKPASTSERQPVEQSPREGASPPSRDVWRGQQRQQQLPADRHE